MTENEDVPMMKIKLQQVVDAIESADDEWRGSYDAETGEDVWLGDPDYDKDHEKTWELLRSSEDRFYQYPTKYEIHEYGIMEDFVYDLPDGPIRDELARAIDGRGAFRMFKSTIRYHGIEQQWYDHRDEAYRQIAIRWCRDNELEYEE